jgi:hypothetical protein
MPAPRNRPPAARFCPHCGTPLVPRDDHGVVRPTCPACGFIAYQNPAPPSARSSNARARSCSCAAAEPQVGLWGLPAGFMEYGESPEETAIRETRGDRPAHRHRSPARRLPRRRPGGPRVVLLIYRARIVGGRLRPATTRTRSAGSGSTAPGARVSLASTALREYHREVKAGQRSR